MVPTIRASFEVEGRPVASKLRYLTPELKQELEKQVNAMLASGVIQPSKSPWVSAPVFVQKKGGDWRLCLDYRRVNAQTVPDRYPLPLLWDQVQRAAHHRYFTCIDLNSGFWNLPLEEESRKYTAFITHVGVFEFNVLPFGMRNAPSEFQRLMDQALGDLYNDGVFCYIDDIVIYANTPEENLQRTEEVLKRLRDQGLFIQISKCQILQPQVKILGHIVSFDGIQPDENKVRAVWEARPPKDKKELRSFLGLTSYLRRFVPNFSQQVAPLNGLLKKNAQYLWNEECEGSFEWLRAVITDQVMLSAPRGDGLFVIACDACDYGVGAALLQLQDEDLAVIEFASKSLSEVQKRWPTYEKEAYAIRWSVEKFEAYVKTGTTLILTDHQSLKWMSQASSGKVQRWSLYLQQFDLRIKHIPGELNCLADWLSRSVAPDVDEHGDLSVIEVPAFTAKEDEPAAVKPGRKEQGLVPYVPNTEDLMAGYKDMGAEDEKATYVAPDKLRYSIRTNKLYIPPNCRDLFIFWFHSSRYGGHCGVNRTLRRMGRWVWWPRMNLDVRNFVKQCLICIRHGRPPRPVTASGVLSRPLPFQLVSVDLVGPLKWGIQEWSYLCMVDHYSRYMVTRATKEPPTAHWVCNTFEEAWLGTFQAPTAILSDRGPQFRASTYREFVTEKLMCLLVYTSPYYPQGNAVNEASHKAIGASLTAMAELPDSTSFPAALRDATMVHNSIPHVHTGQTPNFMIFGMELAMPGWQKYQRAASEREARALVFATQKQLQCARAQFTEERVQDAKETNQIAPGDWVVYHLSSYERGALNKADLSEKFKAAWSLPARVVEVHDKVCTVLPWGVEATGRQVPLALVKKLEGTVPAVLVAANAQLLEKVQPRTIRHWSLQRTEEAPISGTWPDILSGRAPAAPGAPGEERGQAAPLNHGK
jgi:transposase InsO family protein